MLRRFYPGWATPTAVADCLDGQLFLAKPISGRYERLPANGKELSQSSYIRRYGARWPGRSSKSWHARCTGTPARLAPHHSSPARRAGRDGRSWHRQGLVASCRVCHDGRPEPPTTGDLRSGSPGTETMQRGGISPRHAGSLPSELRDAREPPISAAGNLCVHPARPRRTVVAASCVRDASLCWRAQQGRLVFPRWVKLAGSSLAAASI